MINLLSHVSLVAANSSGNVDSVAGLLLALPIMLIPFLWLFFVFVIWGSMFVFAIGGSILWIFMLVDLVNRDFVKKDEKVVWAVILALTGVIGAIVYYFVVKRGNN